MLLMVDYRRLAARAGASAIAEAAARIAQATVRPTAVPFDTDCFIRLEFTI